MGWTFGLQHHNSLLEWFWLRGLLSEATKVVMVFLSSWTLQKNDVGPELRSRRCYRRCPRHCQILSQVQRHPSYLRDTLFLFFFFWLDRLTASISASAPVKPSKNAAEESCQNKEFVVMDDLLIRFSERGSVSKTFSDMNYCVIKCDCTRKFRLSFVKWNSQENRETCELPARPSRKSQALDASSPRIAYCSSPRNPIAFLEFRVSARRNELKRTHREYVWPNERLMELIVWHMSTVK